LDEMAGFKVALAPGNGGGDLEDCMWYPWIRDQVCFFL